MTRLLIVLINLYQKIPGRFHDYCRHYPTCSEYAKIALTHYGFFKGSTLALKRILKCNPWGSFGYDPVPLKEEK